MSSFSPLGAARAAAILVVIAAGGLTAACGYRPLYGQAATPDAAVTRELAAIAVKQIPDRIGQQMRTALERRLRLKGQPEIRYALTVGLGESLQTLAEERSGDVTRANLALTGTYTLVRAADGARLTHGKARAVASYNLLDSHFATLAAQDSARERAIELLADELRTRLAVYFQGPRGAGPTAPR